MRYASSRCMPCSTEGEQDALGEQRAARDLQVGGHAVGVHDHPARDAQREVLHVVDQDRGVGQDHALGARVRDVALVPQRHVLQPGLGVAAQHPRQAADALGGDRVALVRHRARALLARLERLLDLAHLGALEVADLLREALEPGAGERDRAQQLGVAVARDDLGGDRLGRQPQPLQHALLVLRAERGVGADRAGDRAGRRLGEGALEALGVAVGLIAKPASLSPKDVGSAWTPWVRPTHSVSACSRARSASAAASSRAPGTITSPARRSCRASAVSSTSDEVRPKWIQRPAGPASRQNVDEGGHVMVRDRLALLHRLDREGGSADRFEVLSPVGPSSASAAATSTSRQAVIRASSVQISPSCGRV